MIQLWFVLYDRNSPALMWNGRVGRQSRLSSSSSTTDEDGIFVNSASSRLLERAHDILMWAPSPFLGWTRWIKKKKKTISLTNATRQRRVCLTIPRFEVLGTGLPVSSFSALCLCGISPASPDFYSIAKTSMLGKLKTPNCPKLGISVWMVVCRYVPCDWLATNPGSPPSLAQSQLR